MREGSRGWGVARSTKTPEGVGVSRGGNCGRDGRTTMP